MVNVKDIYIEQHNIKKLVPIDVKQITESEVRVFLWHHTLQRNQIINLTKELAPHLDWSDIENLREKRFLEKQSIRLLLALILGEIVNIKYHYTGSPYLQNKDYKISISHTKNTYALSISKKQHGIDIEQWSEKPFKVAKMFVNTKDKDAITSTNNDMPSTNIYTTLWSAKEAVYKLIDQPGLSLLNDITTIGIHNNDIAIKVLQNNCNVTYQAYKNFVLTVAYN